MNVTMEGGQKKNWADLKGPALQATSGRRRLVFSRLVEEGTRDNIRPLFVCLTTLQNLFAHLKIKSFFFATQIPPL